MSEQQATRGGSPLVRWLLVLVGVIVVLVVGVFIAYSAFRSSRSMPLSVVVYPDAQQLGSVQLDVGHDRLRYVSASPAEEVGNFYLQEIGTERCTRLDNTAGDSDSPAFSMRCVVDGSSFFITQYTVVIVQPGVGDFAGQTLIDMERVWGQ